MTALRIAEFDPADTEALVRMWRASFELGVGVKDFHPIQEQVRYLRETLQPAYRLRVAWEGDALAGFLASNEESVAQLHVRVERIGHGIGTRLLALAKAESSGSLWLYTFAQNTRARRFYERAGFVAIEEGFEPMWQLPDVKYRWVRGGRPDQPARTEDIGADAHPWLPTTPKRILTAMAMPHAAPGQVVDVGPLGVELKREATVALFKGDDLEVMRVVLQAGKSLPPHKVPGEITIHCLEGVVDITSETTSHVLRAGQMLYLRGHALHSVTALQDCSALVTIALRPRE